MAEQEDKGRLWLFPNSYKTTEHQPDLTGNGELPVDVLKALGKYYNENKGNLPKEGMIELNAASWDRESKNGKKPYKFVTFSLKLPREANSIPETPKDEDEDDFSL